MVVARPTPLKVVNINKESKKPTWSFSPLHLFYKMAVAAKLVKAGEVFLPKDIDKLVGKAFQFEAQVFFKVSKGKQYYTEYVKFVSGLGRRQEAPELENTFLVQFNKENDPEDLKQLRNHVINTIKSAENFKGSVIEKQLGEIYQDNDSDEDDSNTESEVDEQETKPEPTKRTRKPVEKAPVEVDEGDDGSPF